MSKARSFTFTLNNYTDDEQHLVQSLSCKYLVFGREIAPETGTPHLQGFVTFPNPRSCAAVRRLLPRCHWEVAVASAAANRVYCTKSGDFHEAGHLPPDGGVLEVDRWRDIIRLAEAGSFSAIKDSYPDVYGLRLGSLERIHRRRPQDISDLDGEGVFHVWVVGPTGCGKSRSARDSNPGAYVKDPCTRWWDGYDGEECVIIDDFDKYQVKQGGDMKRWLDRYVFQAEFKGGMQLIRPKKVVVTSQYMPFEIWDDPKTVEAILRRVEVVDMGWTPPPAIVSTFVPRH